MTAVEANAVYLGALEVAARRDPAMAACLWCLEPSDVDAVLRCDRQVLRELSRSPLPLMRPGPHFGLLLQRGLSVDVVPRLVLGGRHGDR